MFDYWLVVRYNSVRSFLPLPNIRPTTQRHCVDKHFSFSFGRYVRRTTSRNPNNNRITADDRKTGLKRMSLRRFASRAASGPPNRLLTGRARCPNTGFDFDGDRSFHRIACPVGRAGFLISFSACTRAWRRAVQIAAVAALITAEAGF